MMVKFYSAFEIHKKCHTPVQLVEVGNCRERWCPKCRTDTHYSENDWVWPKLVNLEKAVTFHNPESGTEV